MRKAAEALGREGRTVHVLFADGVRWAAQSNEETFQNSPYTWRKICRNPDQQRLRYLFWRIVRKMWKLLGNLNHTYCRSYGAYMREGIDWKPDLIIGHNHVALVPLAELGENSRSCFFSMQKSSIRENSTRNFNRINPTISPKLLREVILLTFRLEISHFDSSPKSRLFQ